MSALVKSSQVIVVPDSADADYLAQGWSHAGAEPVDETVKPKRARKPSPVKLDSLS